LFGILDKVRAYGVNAIMQVYQSRPIRKRTGRAGVFFIGPALVLAFGPELEFFKYSFRDFSKINVGLKNSKVALNHSLKGRLGTIAPQPQFI
jgi:hypothetical protein